MLYIFWILHQTTTIQCKWWNTISCISFESYIKPQLNRYDLLPLRSCISFESYIKPQHFPELNILQPVVYLLNPTSNHNHRMTAFVAPFVVYLLNPTSNHNANGGYFVTAELYIFWILHQTTTYIQYPCNSSSCISFESYIKPQPNWEDNRVKSVVYLLNPTSNHNKFGMVIIYALVVYLLNPTSNHNYSQLWKYFNTLYIFWILHQTTTPRCNYQASICCISFESYIKPQLISICWAIIWVVYLLNPTSNHNLPLYYHYTACVVYLLNPTSNHNPKDGFILAGLVVYLLNPTSNHNL